jgi:hypothetical protein
MIKDCWVIFIDGKYYGKFTDRYERDRQIQSLRAIHGEGKVLVISGQLF